ncbi:AP2 domain transcription factor AP2IX-3 [Besnoitia besnoiti]|uniref:AP2 domain transcription factor AP2IX-3 n=1 Tax=Besnoitia besnoiti TaxID=94643 RepID=A0A2A9MFA6_BESBE|nr:AP2 domain transcription factor AP2IX-3 [Besnoitia besnoiti]PFH36599.1 AP2 domain transcription factor AP2IX-3 [Besnoitia besnoiti]
MAKDLHPGGGRDTPSSPTPSEEHRENWGSSAAGLRSSPSGEAPLCGAGPCPAGCEAKPGAPLLTLERQAIRFLLLDLKNKCLANLAPLLLPAVVQRHVTHLGNHIRRVEDAVSCEGLESFLLIFADCVKTMSLPSQLSMAEQAHMMGLVASLGEQLDAQGL